LIAVCPVLVFCEEAVTKARPAMLLPAASALLLFDSSNRPEKNTALNKDMRTRDLRLILMTTRTFFIFAFSCAYPGARE
jgi:hypothetical protein